MNLEQWSQFQFSEELYKKFDIRKVSGELIVNKKELVQLVNQCIFRKCARTSKEKYDVLELRDKVLKLIRHEVNNSTLTSSTFSEISNEHAILFGNYNISY